MNRSVEQALLSLLPTHSSELPRQLVELASSLLAQSRLRASTLKAEEDIARTYACAHIACDRLKISLDLPPIDPRPPIPPRIYKRLYSHLDKILPNSSLGTPKSRRISTPSSKARGLGSSPSKVTPSKAKSLAELRNRTPSKAHGAIGSAAKKRDSSALPPWVQPAVRFVCKELGREQLGPTIMAGMAAIATPHGRKSEDEWVSSNLTALLAAILYYASAELPSHEQDGNLTGSQYTAEETKILNVFKQVQVSVLINGQEEPGAWEGWSNLKKNNFRSALMKADDHSWLDSDWFRGLKELQHHAVGETPGLEGSDVGDDEKIQVKRADTMFQDKYDFLSERKRQEYKIWKAGIMKRIEEIQVIAPDAMDTDP